MTQGTGVAMQLEQWVISYPKQAADLIALVKDENEKLQSENASLVAMVAQMRDALDDLARLGNTPNFGNSVGNIIAQDALALAATPAESLAALRAKHYEECAAIVMSYRTLGVGIIADTIRRMAQEKGQA